MPRATTTMHSRESRLVGYGDIAGALCTLHRISLTLIVEPYATLAAYSALNDVVRMITHQLALFVSCIDQPLDDIQAQ
jgi:hypothetical protein